MTLDDLVRRHGSWLESGMGTGPVVSCRVRLARNIHEFSFPGWASEEEKQSVWDVIYSVIMNAEPDYLHWSMNEITSQEKELLFERHLISQELAVKDDGCGVFVAPDESVSIMVNEEDHLRIQSLQSGLNLKNAWKVADELDDELEASLAYAFSSKLGYLTSCPSNVGTGLRASVMLHLPGLVLMDEMDPVINGISKIGLAVRGMWGEGTEAAGNMFQISNQITLGRSEGEIIEHLNQIVIELIEHENNARERLLDSRAITVEDHVARAFGILSNARLISSSEALNLLSTLRFGVDLGMIDEVSRRQIDTLFISIQPAHLQKMHNTPLDADDRDMLRANVLRTFMDNFSEEDKKTEEG